MERFYFGETDLTPVGLFRIIFGLQLFNWFWQLYRYLTAFFTDDGRRPRRYAAARLRGARLRQPTMAGNTRCGCSVS